MSGSVNSDESVSVLVCGSRDWHLLEEIQIALIDLGERYANVTVIHGAARGADRLAGIIADALGYAVDPHPADWEVGPQTRAEDIRTRPDGSTYDSAAGRRRNIEMLEKQPDLVLAFQRNGSGGTQHTINEARRRGIPVEVLSVNA